MSQQCLLSLPYSVSKDEARRCHGEVRRCDDAVDPRAEREGGGTKFLLKRHAVYLGCEHEYKNKAAVTETNYNNCD